MTHLPIPIQVLYAGLAGTVLALIVATAMNRWSPRVFFLLALRLAIGWHFLFEGLYKVNSHLVGPTETSKPFTSEPYFRNAPGPVGAYMRRQFGDPNEVITAKVKSPKTFSAEEFDKLPAEQQAAECPRAVAAHLDPLESKAPEAVAAIKAEAEKELAAADAKEKKALKDVDAALAEDLKRAETPLEKKEAEAKAEAARKKAKDDAAAARRNAQAKAARYADGQALFTAVKATYARWVYGVEGRDTLVKGVTGDVSLTTPQRLQHIEWLRREVKAAEDRQTAGLGNGYGTDAKRAAEWRADLIAAEYDLARDANAFVAELKQILNSGKPLEEPAETNRGQLMDKVTMWFLVAVGACLMAGLLTRFACVLGAGFLVVTYLTYPPFPWYPLPPNTEGNPLFVNKNAIECLALLVLATFPTGRWMGLDALIARLRGRRYDGAA
jgi:uncharacterized membrane protein YphA (DoxX/SURF4 family)